MPATGHLRDPARSAIRRVLEDPVFELIPMKRAHDQALHLPAGARVSVTVSPVKGIEPSLDLCEDLVAMGFRVTAHLSARQVRDRSHLEQILQRLDRSHISEAFVVGGDASQSGRFADAAALLEAMNETGIGLDRIGIAAYPEGHAFIPDDRLDVALLDKQPYASSMTSQMCFSGSAILAWLRSQRAAGIAIPLVLGIPGVADRMRLLKISARIGVGDSMRFLKKNAGAAARFVVGGRYDPADLLEDLGEHLDDAELGFEGVHIFTFNSCESTVEWWRRYLAALD